MAAYVRYMSSPLGEVFHEPSGVARYEHLAAVFWPLTCDTCHVWFDDTPLNQGTSVSFLLILFQIFHYVSGHFGGVERDSSQNLPHFPGIQGE